MASDTGRKDIYGTFTHKNTTQRSTARHTIEPRSNISNPNSE